MEFYYCTHFKICSESGALCQDSGCPIARACEDMQEQEEEEAEE